MKNKTLLLPGFHLRTLRRKPRSEPQRLAERLQLIREKSISQLHDCFGPFIPNTLLQTATSGTFSRQRLFTKANTFWGSLPRYSMRTVAVRKWLESFRLLQPARRLRFLHHPRLPTAKHDSAFLWRTSNRSLPTRRVNFKKR